MSACSSSIDKFTGIFREQPVFLSQFDAASGAENHASVRKKNLKKLARGLQ